MHLPNYTDGSIVNLMSTVMTAYGKRSAYKNLQLLKPGEVRKHTNVVLIIIDGLGYEFLKRYGRHSFLYEHMRGKITSVFPSTTASSITSFTTGKAPAEHGITGWFMYMKELGAVMQPLRFSPRNSDRPYSENGILFKEVFDHKTMLDTLGVRSYVIQAKHISDSDYSRNLSGKSQTLSFETMRGFLRQIKKAVKQKGRTFAYAYWHHFDEIAHLFGIDSPEAVMHFLMLDNALEHFFKSSKDTLCIITADHGLIDMEPKKVIRMEDHPILKECMTLPLCGEARASYCYLHPEKVGTFKRYIQKNLSHACTVYKSETLLKKGIFGTRKPHKKLCERIGDYTIIMKENYIILDRIVGEGDTHLVGYHGGTSKDEMHVPLIVVDT